MANLYKVLGVKDFASPDEIKIAYRKLSKKLHPDVNDGDKFFEEKFKEIQHAYEILCDPYKKSIHDSNLKDYLESINNSQAKEEKSNQKDQAFNFKQESNSSYSQKKNSNYNSDSQKADYSFIKPWFFTFIIAIIIVAIITKRNSSEEYTNNSSLNKTNEYSSNQETDVSLTDQETYKPIDTLISLEEVNSNNNLTTVDVIENDPNSSKDKSYFTINSSKDEVLEVQGNPTGIHNYETLGEEVWNYGFSTVTFRNNRVSEFSNSSKNLKAILLVTNASKNTNNYFTISSTKDKVLEVQGNPTGIHKYETLGEEVWNYGFSTVTFRNGRVSEYSNSSRNLQAKLEIINSTKKSAGYFSIGSTKDEVLQVQGDPTSIQKYETLDEEIWHYDFSTVTFKNNIVSEYSNSSKNLNVRL